MISGHYDCFFNISVMNEPFLKHIIEYRLRTRRAQPSVSAWRAASRTPRKQIKAHVTQSNGTPLQYSCLENSTDRGAWWAAVHGVAKSWTRLRDFILTFMHWRRKWQPTPVILPGESQGRGSLVGCRLWSRIELDITEAT